MKRGVQMLLAACHAISRLADAIAALLVALVVVVNSLQIISRYGIGSPLTWSDEVMRYSMVWAVFLSGSSLVLHNEHMATGLNPKSLWLRRMLEFLRILLVGFFALMLAWYGWPLAFHNSRYLSPAAEIPMIVPYLGIAIGAALMVIYSITLALEAAMKWGE